MKILKKRILAFAIDCFVLLQIVGILDFFLYYLFSLETTVHYIIFLILFLFRDMTFKNASIGKKIMNIQIFNDHWDVPRPILLIKRSFFMTSVGFIIFFKSVILDKSRISIFDFEKKHLHTWVIDKTIFNELLKNAQIGNEEYHLQMNRLYAAYLRDNYM